MYSYNEYLSEVDSDRLENVPAPEIAINYWGLPNDAKFRDLIIVVRRDEARHKDVNHKLADSFDKEA